MVRVFAPFTPFLTEHMYQNLKHLIVGSEVQDSVHYLMIPDARKDLIDDVMERAVARYIYLFVLLDINNIIILS
jgi:isoleucyl-tRNA synthetase